jgi:hypothetical protein
MKTSYPDTEFVRRLTVPTIDKNGRAERQLRERRMRSHVVIAFGLAAILLADSNKSAPAEGVTTIDPAGIRRGAQIAKYCFLRPDVGQQSKCFISALQQMPTASDYVHLGYVYYSFVMWARADEILRYDPQNPAQNKLKGLYRQMAEANYSDLNEYQQKLFVDLRTLCAVTDTDCALAERMERLWAAHK